MKPVRQPPPVAMIVAAAARPALIVLRRISSDATSQASEKEISVTSQASGKEIVGTNPTRDVTRSISGTRRLTFRLDQFSGGTPGRINPPAPHLCSPLDDCRHRPVNAYRPPAQCVWSMGGSLIIWRTERAPRLNPGAPVGRLQIREAVRTQRLHPGTAPQAWFDRTVTRARPKAASDNVEEP